MSITDRLSYIDRVLQPDLQLSHKETNILKAHVVGSNFTGVRKFVYVIFEGLKSLFFCSNKQQAESFLTTHIAYKLVTRTEFRTLDRNQTNKTKKDIIFSAPFLDYADKVASVFLNAIAGKESLENIVNVTNNIARTALPLECFITGDRKRTSELVEAPSTDLTLPFIFERALHHLQVIPPIKLKEE